MPIFYEPRHIASPETTEKAAGLILSLWRPLLVVTVSTHFQPELEIHTLWSIVSVVSCIHQIEEPELPHSCGSLASSSPSLFYHTITFL